MNSALTRLGRTLVAGFLAVTFGAVAGTATAWLAAPPNAIAQQGCEEDECNKDCNWWGCTETCIGNTGDDTWCDVTGENSCKTKACGLM